MGHMENGQWVSDTGCDRPVIAVDCDGLLNNKGEGRIGVDNGAIWDLSPLRKALALGCRVAIMTCNDLVYVAGVLQERGVDAYADLAREYKVPPFDDGTVLVTDRKVLADQYWDDRGRQLAYGQDPEPLFRELGLDRNGDGVVDEYDYRTPEYKSYVAAVVAAAEGRGDEMTVHAALCTARDAAAAYTTGGVLSNGKVVAA